MVVARGGDEKWIVIGIRIVESHSRYQVRQVRAVIVTINAPSVVKCFNGTIRRLAAIRIIAVTHCGSKLTLKFPWSKTSVPQRVTLPSAGARLCAAALSLVLFD